MEGMVMKLDALPESFTTFSDFGTVSDIDLSREIRNLIIQYLQSFKNNFRDYVLFHKPITSELGVHLMWI
jgi:hypothetical protein